MAAAASSDTGMGDTNHHQLFEVAMRCTGWDVPDVGVVPSALPMGSFVLPQCPRHVWEEVQVLLLPPGGDPHHLPGAHDSRDRGAPRPPLPHHRPQ